MAWELINYCTLIDLFSRELAPNSVFTERCTDNGEDLSKPEIISLPRQMKQQQTFYLESDVVQMEQELATECTIEAIAKCERNGESLGSKV